MCRPDGTSWRLPGRHIFALFCLPTFKLGSFSPHCTGVEMEVIEGLRFLASLLFAGTGRTEGGEKTQPFKRFHSRLFMYTTYECQWRLSLG